MPFGVDGGAATTTLGEKLSAVELEELKRRVSALLVEADERVVVFIDDIFVRNGDLLSPRRH